MKIHETYAARIIPNEAEMSRYLAVTQMRGSIGYLLASLGNARLALVQAAIRSYER